MIHDYKFHVYLACKGPCDSPALSDRHLRGSYRNPVRAFRQLRNLQRYFPKSNYYLAFRNLTVSPQATRRAGART